MHEGVGDSAPSPSSGAFEFAGYPFVSPMSAALTARSGESPVARAMQRSMHVSEHVEPRHVSNFGGTARGTHRGSRRSVVPEADGVDVPESPTRSAGAPRPASTVLTAAHIALARSADVSHGADAPGHSLREAAPGGLGASLPDTLIPAAFHILEARTAPPDVNDEVRGCPVRACVSCSCSCSCSCS